MLFLTVLPVVSLLRFSMMRIRIIMLGGFRLPTLAVMITVKRLFFIHWIFLLVRGCLVRLILLTVFPFLLLANTTGKFMNHKGRLCILILSYVVVISVFFRVPRR